MIAGGSRVEDAIYYAKEFAAAGFDFLSLSKGGKFEDAQQPKVGQAVYPYTGQSGYECMPTVLSDADWSIRPQCPTRCGDQESREREWICDTDCRYGRHINV